MSGIKSSWSVHVLGMEAYCNANIDRRYLLRPVGSILCWLSLILYKCKFFSHLLTFYFTVLFLHSCLLFTIVCTVHCCKKIDDLLKYVFEIIFYQLIHLTKCLKVIVELNGTLLNKFKRKECDDQLLYF